MPVVNKTYNINVTTGQLSDYFITATFVQGSFTAPLTVNQSGNTITITSNGLPVGDVGDYQISISFNSIDYCP